MTPVIVDTNALLLPFSHNLNISSELNRLLGAHEIVVPEPIIGELGKLAKTDRNARAALQLATKSKVVKANSLGDEAILEQAEALGGVILSNDKEIIKRAKARHIKVIRLRGKCHLEFDNDWAD